MLINSKIKSNMLSVNSYSQAFYELSKESNILNESENVALAFLNLIKENHNFEDMIQSPINKPDDQIRVINAIFEKYSVNKIIKNFFSLLAKKRKIFYLKKILNDFLQICSKNRGEAIATLISAKKLNTDQISQIKEDIKREYGKNIKLDYSYNPNLIGGLVLKIGSVMIDTSLENRLKQIRNKMLET